MALVPVMLLVTALLLVAVAFTDAMLQGMRASRLGWQGERALHEADRALLTALDRWDASAAAALRPGESDSLPGLAGAGVTVLVQRTRLHSRAFAVAAEARVQDGGPRPGVRRVGRTVLLEWPLPPVMGALTAGGAVQVDAGAVVLGAEATPAGWEAECLADVAAAPARALVARAVHGDSAATLSGAGAGAQRLSDREVVEFGDAFDASFAELAGLGGPVLVDSLLRFDGIDGARCAHGMGSADRRTRADACTRRWPIVLVHAPHGLRLAGAEPVQGVLLVDGDVRVGAGVRVAGLLMVRGRLEMDADGGGAPEVIGAVVVRDAAQRGSRLGTARVHASRCALRAALAAAGVPRPISHHGWSERP
jgi:hypothetical protein